MTRRISDATETIIAVMRMRLSTKDALEYLKHDNHPMSKKTFERRKKEIKTNSLKRLYALAQTDVLQDQHMERIDNVRLIEKEMWTNYHNEESPYRKTMILKEIKELQPYISTYYETAHKMLEIKSGTGQTDPGVSGEGLATEVSLESVRRLRSTDK